MFRRGSTAYLALDIGSTLNTSVSRFALMLAVCLGS